MCIVCIEDLNVLLTFVYFPWNIIYLHFELSIFMASFHASRTVNLLMNIRKVQFSIVGFSTKLQYRGMKQCHVYQRNVDFGECCQRQLYTQRTLNSGWILLKIPARPSARLSFHLYRRNLCRKTSPIFNLHSAIFQCKPLSNSIKNIKY